MNDKDYLGSKYSEHVFGDKGGKVTENYISDEQKEYDSKVKDIFWKDYLDEARSYDQPQTMSNV